MQKTFKSCLKHFKGQKETQDILLNGPIQAICPVKLDLFDEKTIRKEAISTKWSSGHTGMKFG